MSTSMDFKEYLVSYKTYHDTYRNTYQISRYISLVEKVYRYTPTNELGYSYINTTLDTVMFEF
jgi:hypothetical protein